MKVEKDFEEFIRLLNAKKVEYLIVGAYAVAQYAEPRNTGDIDFLVHPTRKNASRIIEVLKAFGFAELKISLRDLMDPEMVLQLGFAPVRIDLLTSLGDMNFNEMFEKRTIVKLGKTEASFISLDDLIISKKIAGRPKDKADLVVLRRMKKMMGRK